VTVRDVDAEVQALDPEAVLDPSAISLLANASGELPEWRPLPALGTILARCAVCGERFYPRRSHARTCSNRCRQRRSRERRAST
jgi:hypothetical protein